MGLLKASGDNTDRLVGYQVAISQKGQITSYDSGWIYGARSGAGSRLQRHYAARRGNQDDRRWGQARKAPDEHLVGRGDD